MYEGGIFLTDIILCILFAASVIFSLFSGSIEQTSASVLEGAKSAVELMFTLCAGMCLWCGILNIARKAGMLNGAKKLMRPIVRLVFPRIPPESKTAELISMNMAANFLGLGSAATPFGIAAIKEMKRTSKLGDKATDEMCAMVVINSASIQLLPTTMFALRAEAGSSAPFEIFLPVLLSSVVSLFIGIIVVKCFGRKNI